MIYERFHTRDIGELSGLAKRMPKFAFFFVLFALSSIGLPGLNGFVSEFLTVLGAFTSEHLGPGFAAFAATGVILGSIYMLYMVARVIWGPLKFPATDHAHEENSVQLPVDIGRREIAILVPLAVLVIVIGLLPTSLMSPMHGPIEVLRQPLAQAPEQPRVRVRRPAVTLNARNMPLAPNEKVIAKAP
jgi:NADH-quinone oxidoreductase subunit M